LQASLDRMKKSPGRTPPTKQEQDDTVRQLAQAQKEAANCAKKP